MIPLLKAELFQEGKTVLAVRPLVFYGCHKSTAISIQLNMPDFSMSLLIKFCVSGFIDSTIYEITTWPNLVMLRNRRKLTWENHPEIKFISKLFKQIIS